MKGANFIIAGTEKAGTTSVFSYLSQHPEVTASRRKETNFFRGDHGSLADYARFFPQQGADTPIFMEGSPAYLGEARTVVPRMARMIPNVRLLFILREPIDRLLSSFRFHRARMNLPQSMDFHDYLRACLDHEKSPACACAANHSRLDDWYLKVLCFGRYADYLEHYFNAFPRYNIKVSFYDDLCMDPQGFMEEVSAFLEIDEAFWSSANFEPANVTFSGRNRHVHRLAMRVNDRLEPILRPRPRLKSAVVRVYKRINGDSAASEEISVADRTLLEAYYGPANRDLEALLGVPLPHGWVVQSQRPGPSRRTGAGLNGRWLQ